MSLASYTSSALLPNASAAPKILNILDPLMSSTAMPRILNVTNGTETAGNIPGFTLSETVVMTTAMVALLLITLFGNVLVLGIFYQYMPLRTVTNYFIVSLANADLLVAVLSIPIWIAYIQVDLAELTFGAELYRLWICIDITSGVSSVMNLSLVSVDRYIHILMPLHYHGIMTSKRAKVIILCIWLYAIGLAMIKGIAFHWERPNYEILVFIMGFVLPLSVMGWCYYKIFGEARIHSRAMYHLDTARRKERSKEFKAAKTIAVVIFAFFICWCPFFVLNLVYGLYPTWRIPGELITVSKWLHYTNSALNPIIYACCNLEYRSAFRALLTRKLLQNGNFNSGNSHNAKGKQARKSEDSSNGLIVKAESTLPNSDTADQILCESYV